jgi:hypothetical protein
MAPLPQRFLFSQGTLIFHSFELIKPKTSVCLLALTPQFSLAPLSGFAHHLLHPLSSWKFLANVF